MKYLQNNFESYILEDKRCNIEISLWAQYLKQSSFALINNKFDILLDIHFKNIHLNLSH